MKRLLTILALLSGMALAQTSNYPVSINSFAANCIPNATTAITLQCGGLTDNSTNVISTEALLLPDGTAALPAYSFTSDSGFGWYRSSASHMTLATTGSVVSVDLNASANSVKIPSGGGFTWTSSSSALGTADTQIARRGAANFRLGFADVNGVPVAQAISVQNAITGSNLAPAAFSIVPSLGTGTGAGGQFSLLRGLMQATGTTAHTSQHAFVICESKTLSNTSATVQALANIALASNSAGGARGSITVTATDGTNFDSETQDFVVSYVNKATVGTVGTAAITASTAANNSGSATIGMTATFSGTTLSINATPVFTTIVPTTVTSYIELQNHGAGAVTCQ